MKKYFLCLIFLCGNAMAQPTSVAGITPGKTTTEELKALVVDPTKITNDNFHIVDLKGLNDKMAFVKSKNGIVYEVEISLMFDPEVVVALVSKYGKPSRKIGEIKKVVCQNKLGAKFDRVEGRMVEYWRMKDGIQAALVHKANKCDENSYMNYLIYHEKIKTEVDAIEENERAKQFGNKVEKINKGI
jgi:hypothetical protein